MLGGSLKTLSFAGLISGTSSYFFYILLMLFQATFFLGSGAKFFSFYIAFLLTVSGVNRSCVLNSFFTADSSLVSEAKVTFFSGVLKNFYS